MAGAVLAAGWLAFSLRSLYLEDEARGLIPTPPARAPAADVARMERLLLDAREANPDIRPDLVRAVLLSNSGQPAKAIGIVDGILRREPDNLRALRALYVLVQREDPGRADAVAQRSREVAPPVGGG